MAGADCVCFGTLIQRDSRSRDTLARLLHGFSDGTVVYDVNLRKDCAGREVIDASLRLADIVKLNGEESTELAVMFSFGGDSLPERVDSLPAYGGLDCCLATLGRDGAYAASRR